MKGHDSQPRNDPYLIHVIDQSLVWWCKEDGVHVFITFGLFSLNLYFHFDKWHFSFLQKCPFSCIQSSFPVSSSHSASNSWPCHSAHTMLSHPTFRSLTSSCVTVVQVEGGWGIPFTLACLGFPNRSEITGEVKQKPHSRREANLSSALFREPKLASRDRLQGPLWYSLSHYLPPMFKIPTHSMAPLSLSHCTMFSAEKISSVTFIHCVSLMIIIHLIITV